MKCIFNFLRFKKLNFKSKLTQIMLINCNNLIVFVKKDCIYVKSSKKKL